jgi:hypothetical protein
MSIIQDIRDKYAKLTVVLIALALVGFILTDYFSGKSRGMLGGPSSTIGVVNGTKIGFEATGLSTCNGEFTGIRSGMESGDQPGVTE